MKNQARQFVLLINLHVYPEWGSTTYIYVCFVIVSCVIVTS